MKQKDITQLNIHDVPRLSPDIKYFDGEIAFADNITSIPQLREVFKVNFVAFVFCLSGNLTLKLNNRHYEVKCHDALFIDLNTVVSDVDHGDDFDCKILVISTDVGLNFINKTIFDALLEIQANPILHFTADEIELMLRYYELAKFKMEHPELNYGKETMINILRGYALDLLSSISKHLDKPSDSILRQGDKIFRKFVIMLADNNDNRRSVRDFAHALCISPKYLTSLCNIKAGKTASELIAVSVIGRIRQMLLYSDKSIKEISHELGFTNFSYFGKFVKKYLGVSPINFRKLNGYGK